MADVVLLLGSNMEPEANLPQALAALKALGGFTTVASSRTFITPAIGPDGKPSGQEDFHNAAVRINTELDPGQLRRVLRKIEAELGRVRTADKFAPRPIDLDIALYAAGSGDLEETLIQDPDLLRFPHVAVPAAEVAPNWILSPGGEALIRAAARVINNETEITVR